MLKIALPEHVKYIIDKLSEAGYEAFSVGGCVRDSLLGREPGDWDITTSARPEEIKQVFRHTVDTGIEHGTVTVLIYPDTLRKEGYARREFPEMPDNDEGAPTGRPATYEVTTYRIDGTYKDGRHPEQVTFTENLREDLRRRDFTINAMAYNESAGLVDLFGGTEDLKKGIIRCVGDPDERFDEDALRILRAVRFAAQLGFTIEPETAAAVTRHAEHLDAVSGERIFAELNKLLCSGHAERLQDIFGLGLSRHIADGFEAVRPMGPGTGALLDEEHPEKTLPAIPAERKGERYGLICRKMEADGVKKLLRNLKSDLDTIRLAAYLAPRLLLPLPGDRYEFKLKMAETEPEHFRTLLLLKKEISASAEYRKLCGDEDIDRLLSLFDRIMERREPVYMKDLVVTGSDLLRAGVPAGPGLGAILSEMLDDVRRFPVHNSVLYLFSRHLRKQDK